MAIAQSSKSGIFLIIADEVGILNITACQCGMMGERTSTSIP